MNRSDSSGVIPRLDAIGFGGDWTPEQWPESIVDEDLRLMREARVNLVTVGVFAWAHLEPTPGDYRFDWLDRILDKSLAAGICVDLATATASPPPWMGHRWPETLPATEMGTRLAYGARQQYCPSSPIYAEFAARLTQQIAARYSNHDAVVMWHVGNEYGAHTYACWCDTCAEAFRTWLMARYGGLDELNRAWSTSFWSQRYSEWAEVIPPRKTPYFPNPTAQLDFKRFSSDALLQLFVAERDIIRAHSPSDKPITTNFMRFFPHADYWAWAREEDVVSDDWYPDLSDPRSHIEGAAGADLMRSLGGGRPWLLMEQAVSAINWRSVNPPKAHAEYRRWSLQQVAHGADAILHFQWRASIGGAEKWHSGMLPHAGPRTRTWREVVALGEELEALSGVRGARTEASIAIVLDWSSWWALELDSRPSTRISQVERLLSWYRPLWERGFAIDFAHPESDLSRYQLVLVPQSYAVSDQGAERVRQAASSGSTVVVGFFSGAVDERDIVRPGGYPAPWTELLGIWVEEYRPLLPDEDVALHWETSQGNGEAVGRQWSEHVHLDGAEAVLTYARGDLSGSPAVTRRRTPAAGDAWYVSTALDDDTMTALLAAVARNAGVSPVLSNTPAGVEATLRATDRERFLFLLNHTGDDRQVTLPADTTWTDAIDRRPIGGSVTIPAGDVIVLVTDEGTDEAR